MNVPPFLSASRVKSGVFYLLRLVLTVPLVTTTTPTLYALADDGATDALALRYQAELAIAQEVRAGHRDLAVAMQDSLSPLLKEYLVTRDGTLALDTVDAAFVREQFKVARAMEEPGVALAMDIYAGEATGFEHDLQTALSRMADHQAARISEHVVDAYERQIERQLDKVEHELEKVNTASGRFDAKFEAKLEAKLDAAAARMELKAEKAEAKAELKALREEAKVEKIVEKVADKPVEKIVEKVADKPVEKIAPPAPEKPADKSESKGKK